MYINVYSARKHSLFVYLTCINHKTCFTIKLNVIILFIIKSTVHLHSLLGFIPFCSCRGRASTPTPCAEPQIENEWRHHFHNNKKLKSRKWMIVKAVTCSKAVTRYAEISFDLIYSSLLIDSEQWTTKVFLRTFRVKIEVFDMKRWRCNKRWRAVIMAIWSGLYVRLATQRYMTINEC